MVFPSLRKKLPWVLTLLILAAGIFLRLNRYLADLPFWGDEAWVAVDLATRSFRDILFNSNYDASFSVPAPGFMLTEKAMISVLGLSETSFRLFPFFCGVAGIFLFKRLLKGLVRPRVLLTALAFFVFSDLLIYYSSELKQYSSDVFFVLLVLVAHSRALKRSMDEKGTTALLLAGVLGLLFSLPIILVLCGLVFGQTAVFYRRKQLSEMGRYLLVGGLWMVIFTLLWWNYYSFNYLRPDVLAYQKPYYLSLPLTFSEWGSFLKKLFAVFRSPLDLSWPGLAALIVATGCWSLWSRDRGRLLPLLLPVLFTVGLSMAERYPFHGRFLAFLLPVFFILVAQGIGQVMEGPPWRLLTGILILAVLMSQPLGRSLKYLIPEAEADIRSLVTYLRSHQKQGDYIYFNNDSQWGFHFYYYLYDHPRAAGRGPLDIRQRGILYEHPVADDAPGQLFNYLTPLQARTGRIARRVFSWDRVEDEQGQLTRLPGGGRTWILLSQVSPEKKKAFLGCFDAFGQKLDQVNRTNAALYLYDLK